MKHFLYIAIMVLFLGSCNKEETLKPEDNKGINNKGIDVRVDTSKTLLIPEIVDTIYETEKDKTDIETEVM